MNVNKSIQLPTSAQTGAVLVKVEAKVSQNLLQEIKTQPQKGVEKSGLAQGKQPVLALVAERTLRKGLGLINVFLL